MDFTSQYFADAQKVIMGILDAERPELMKFHGHVAEMMKADDSVVTQLDKDLEVKLKTALAKFDRKVGFWGEEHGKEGNDKTYWLIDPIDGTESFIRGLPGCRNMLTFVDADQAQFALVYRFTTKDLYAAERGKKTTKNSAEVKLSDRPLNRAWLEFSVNMRVPDGYAVYQNLRPKIAGITVHRDFLEILDGGLEGLVVYKSMGQEWDYAPRALMIETAGGRVSNIGKDSYDMHDKNLIAGTPAVYDDVKSIVETSLKA